ncbi:MAG: sensor domain-containing protein [Candidatus Krumholzibacteriota bacterium]|nr:sensor domain-containing protein [Candidatus Krumholzibacteriota bacterium]
MMSDLINEYLASLKKALAGCDPATVQDALSDAEEHFWTALNQAREESPDISEQEVIAAEIEKFGPPGEIASAYMEIESRIRPAMNVQSGTVKKSASARFFGVFTDPRAYGALFYMFFSLFLGIFYFTWTVSGLSISIGVMILIIGLPFFGFFLMSVRGIALVDGRIIEALLGERMPRRPIYSKRPENWRDRLIFLFTDPLVWKTVVYNIMMLPLSILYFTLTITSISISLTLILRPVLEYVFHLPMIQNNDWSYWTPGYLMPVAVALGILWFFLTLHMARGLGRMQARIAKNMLVRD